MKITIEAETEEEKTALDKAQEPHCMVFAGVYQFALVGTCTEYDVIPRSLWRLHHQPDTCELIGKLAEAAERLRLLHREPVDGR